MTGGSHESSGTPLVLLSRDQGVATIRLDSPHNRNALSQRLVSELASAVRAALDDPEVAVLRLTGNGPVFCSGADLKAPSRSPDAYIDVLQTLMNCSKPVVADLNGSARAGGIALVAVSDIALAPRDVTFAFSEVRIGVLPAVISVPLVRTMAGRPLMKWFLTGEVFSADQAVEAGLLTLAVNAEEIAAARSRLFEDLRLAAPSAVMGIKPLIRGVKERNVADGFSWAAKVSARYFDSPDAAEGVAAFKERRAARWGLAPGDVSGDW